MHCRLQVRTKLAFLLVYLNSTKHPLDRASNIKEDKRTVNDYPYLPVEG